MSHYCFTLVHATVLSLHNLESQFMFTKARPHLDLVPWLHATGILVPIATILLACGWDRGLWPDSIFWACAEYSFRIVNQSDLLDLTGSPRFKSVNRGLPVLDQTRALDPCHRPEGSWALGTRMRHLPSLPPIRCRSIWFFNLQN